MRKFYKIILILFLFFQTNGFAQEEKKYSYQSFGFNFNYRNATDGGYSIPIPGFYYSHKRSQLGAGFIVNKTPVYHLSYSSSYIAQGLVKGDEVRIPGGQLFYRFHPFKPRAFNFFLEYSILYMAIKSYVNEEFFQYVHLMENLVGVGVKFNFLSRFSLTLSAHGSLKSEYADFTYVDTDEWGKIRIPDPIQFKPRLFAGLQIGIF